MHNKTKLLTNTFGVLTAIGLILNPGSAYAGGGYHDEYGGGHKNPTQIENSNDNYNNVKATGGDAFADSYANGGEADSYSNSGASNTTNVRNDFRNRRQSPPVHGFLAVPQGNYGVGAGVSLFGQGANAMFTKPSGKHAILIDGLNKMGSENPDTQEEGRQMASVVSGRMNKAIDETATVIFDFSDCPEEVRGMAMRASHSSKYSTEQIKDKFGCYPAPAQTSFNNAVEEGPEEVYVLPAIVEPRQEDPSTTTGQDYAQLEPRKEEQGTPVRGLW